MNLWTPISKTSRSGWLIMLLLFFQLGLQSCQQEEPLKPRKVVAEIDFEDPQDIQLSKASLKYFLFFVDISYPELTEEDHQDSLTMSFIFDRFVEDLTLAVSALEDGIVIPEKAIDDFIQLELTHMTFKLQSPESQRWYRLEIRKRLLIKEFLKREVLEKVDITPEMAQEYYDQHIEEFMVEPKFCVRQIQMEDQEKAIAFKKECDAGQKTFKEVAEMFENDGSSFELAPCLPLASFPEQFQKTIQKLLPGATSNVLKLDYGEKTIYHVLMLERKIPPIEYSFEEILPKIMTILEKENIEKRLNQKKSEFFQRRKVKINEYNLPFTYIPPEGRRSEP